MDEPTGMMWQFDGGLEEAINSGIEHFSNKYGLEPMYAVATEKVEAPIPVKVSKTVLPNVVVLYEVIVRTPRHIPEERSPVA